MATALLKTTDALFARGAFSAAALADRHFEGLLHAVRAEGRRCADVARLMVVAPVLCHLARCSAAVAREALQVRLLPRRAEAAQRAGRRGRVLALARPVQRVLGPANEQYL